MITSDVVRRVQRIFGDNTEAQIYVTDILDWINDGQMEIVRQTTCLTKHLAIDVPQSNFGPYPLPTDFLFEERVSFGGRPLDKTTLTELDQYASAAANSKPPTFDTPQWFYLWENGIWFYPKASQFGVGLLELWYVNAPATITGTSDPLSIPIGFHEDLVRYCLMRARELNEDYAGADRLVGDFNARMGASRDQSDNPYTSYPVVRDYEGDIWMVPIW